jgi:hypothetical protein
MSEIQTALDQIKKNQPDRQRFIDYYDGNHALNFATEKFRNAFGQTLKSMRDNLCPIVVDSTSDRMEIINFAGDDKDKIVADAAWKLWQRARMELISNNVHSEALKAGCAYLIVWPDEFGEAKFYLQDSRYCTVVEDTDSKKPKYAAKVWKGDDGKLYLNMYYPDRTEKYSTANKYESGTSDLKETIFKPLDGEYATVENPYGRIPVFQFETNPVLSNAIPIQDALNKTVCDKLVAMEFAAFKQRYATGIEVPEDEVTGEKKLPFKAGADRMWFTESKDAKFGEFQSADLEQFLKVADSYRLEMARVSGTPLHFFSINTSDAISGEALKTLESRFTKRVRRNCLNFGPVWSEVIRFAFLIEGSAYAGTLTAQWQSPEQRSEKEFLETLGLKRDTLDVPVDTLREEYGYTEEDIQKFNADDQIVMDEPGSIDGVPNITV